MKAIWNDTILADSCDTIVVEGNHYFPGDSINNEFFTPSDTRTACPWKGNAIYYDITVEGKTISDAAWSYPEPSEAATRIRGYVAFWKGISVGP